MKANFIIRAALQSDAVELKNLFQNTVLAINRRDYSQAEVEDWASCGDDLSNIENMIKTHYFIVAVNQQSEIVGFSSITSQGYLHSMFVQHITNQSRDTHQSPILYPKNKSISSTQLFFRNNFRHRGPHSRRNQ